MCASVDAVYASEVLAKQILMQDKEWSARGRECIFIHDRARVANILTYCTKDASEVSRQDQIREYQTPHRYLQCRQYPRQRAFRLPLL